VTTWGGETSFLTTLFFSVTDIDSLSAIGVASIRVCGRELTSEPTGQPTGQPAGQPTRQPTSVPTGQPTGQPITVKTTCQKAFQHTVKVSEHIKREFTKPLPIMTLLESFRPTGPLSGYLIFLTKPVHGVSRTIIHRGDRSYSASGLVHTSLPPPSSLVPPILTLFLVLSYIIVSPHSPAASRRVGVPLCFHVTLYI
jgi:hypothetical protein